MLNARLALELEALADVMILNRLGDTEKVEVVGMEEVEIMGWCSMFQVGEVVGNEGKNGVEVEKENVTRVENIEGTDRDLL